MNPTFVGRQSELARFAVWLEGPGRLLTFVGAGGIGKTRTARECLARSDIGGHFCSLAEATDEQMLCTALASTLGIALPRIVRPLHRGLAAAMANAGRLPALLVLDNVEQVVDAAARFVDALLDEGIETKLLVTSRERLNLEREEVCELAPLSYDGDHGEALELFAGRARRIRGTPTKHEQRRYAEIVRRLQGHPLALELAASRLEIWSAEQLLEALDEPLTALKGRSRSRPARHQTAEDVVGWSWDLLAPDERRTLTRLAVFADAFDWPAAQAVTEGIAHAADHLQALLHKSLVARSAVETSPRLQIHALIRAYVAEHGDGGEREVSSARHAAYYVETVAEQIGERVWHAPAAVLDAIEGVLPNVIAALQTASASRETTDATCRTLLGTGQVLCRRGLFEPYAALLDVALARDSDRRVRAALLNARGFLWRRAGELEPAEAALIEAGELAGQADDPLLTRASALGNRASLAVQRGDTAAALRYLEQAREPALAPAGSDVRAVLDCNYGRVLYIGGDRDSAWKLAEAALAAQLQSEDFRSAVRAHTRLGFYLQDEGEIDAAAEHQEAALELAEKHGFADVSGLPRMYLGNIARHRFRYGEAIGSLERARRQLAENGNLHYEAVALMDIAIAKALCLAPDAAASIDRAADAAQSLGAHRLVALLSSYRAVVMAHGQPESSRRAIASAEMWLAENRSDVLAPPVALNLATAQKLLDPRRELSAFDREQPKSKSGHLTLARRLAELWLDHVMPPTERPAIGIDGLWLRGEGGPVLDLSSRKPLSRLLRRLVDGYLSDADRGVSRDDLLEAGWPGETLDVAAASNRLRNALSTLRKLGLQGHLETFEEHVRLEGITVAAADISR